MSDQTYYQLERTGKVHATKRTNTFAEISILRGRHYKNDGNPYMASLYCDIMCEIKRIDEAWHEWREDWRHYWCDDEHSKELIQVTMQADEAPEPGWYVLRVRWVNHPYRFRGSVVEKIKS